jgi:hypothetical protein
MKNATNTQFMSSDTELLEKAASNKLSSPETEEWQIEGSPFKIVAEESDPATEDKVYFATWGRGKMTENFETKEEVLEWIENNYWNFLITVLTMAMDSRDLYKIAQIQKQAMNGVNRTEHAEWETKQREHTLHGEIERLKKEEAQNDPIQVFQ